MLNVVICNFREGHFVAIFFSFIASSTDQHFVKSGGDFSYLQNTENLIISLSSDNDILMPTSGCATCQFLHTTPVCRASSREGHFVAIFFLFIASSTDQH
jgi:hypothetical protein